MTLPATMVASLASVLSPGDQAGVVERGEGVGLGEVDEIGHGHGRGTDGDDVGHRGAGGDLGVGGGIGADDVARHDGRVVGLGLVTGDQAGVVERGEGVGLGEVDEIGHGHGLGTDARAT